MNRSEIEYLLLRWIEIFDGLEKGTEDSRHVAYMIGELAKDWKGGE